MSTTTMHFGPEWMRVKNQPVPRSQLPPSPPPANGVSLSTLSTYSALVSPTPVASEKMDEVHPFRYSREELLNIYQDGGGKGGLGLEVERWEGVVREVAAEPMILREMTDAEKKLFAGSLNSEIRRRPSQSTEHFSLLNTAGLERPRMHGASATTSSPMRERFVVMKRRDSAGGTPDLSPTSITRKPSLSTSQVPANSPRTRVGYTSNFDGVLNNGESWVARRRISETSMKGTTVPVVDGHPGEQMLKTSGIREEKEDDSIAAVQPGESPPASSASIISSSQNGLDVVNDNVDDGNGNSVNAGLLSNTVHNGHPEARQSPEMPDLASVEWSYKDPTGQVQGPFRADLMQKWYNEGYFTPDLPMRRTHLDTKWTTVQELARRALDANVFLTQSTSPPSLDRHSPLDNCLSLEPNQNEPFQPAPIRSLRSSTLESYLTGSSLASDSSSSSFGASQLGNSSPDASAFGVYDNHDTNVTTASFWLHDQSTSAFIGNRFSSHEFAHDLTGSLQGTSFGNFAAGIDMNMTGHTFNNHPIVPQNPWSVSSNFPNTPFGVTNTSLPPSIDHPSVDFTNEGIGPTMGSDLPSVTTFENQGSFTLNPLNYANSYDLTGSATFTGVMGQQPYVSQIPDFPLIQPDQTLELRPHEPIGPQPPHCLTNPPPGQSLWKAKFDSRTSKTVPLAFQQNSGVNSNPTRTVVIQDAVLNSADMGTLGQHHKQQELVELLDQKLAVFEGNTRTISASTAALETPETGKASSKAPKLDQSLSDGPALSETSTPVPPKSAWVKDDDGRKKSGSAFISLRAIQEAEVKKQESLKAVGREKDKPRATVESKEVLQPFTTSWGLPTSQAGGRNNTSLSAKEASAPSAPTLTTPPLSPVWTRTLKSPALKKSMKEIQEEEERRKKQATNEIPAATAQKRAYAETTTKAALGSTLIPSTNTNPWTTVGSNGKATASTQTSRPPMHPASFPPSGSGSLSANHRNSVTSNQRIAPNSPARTRPVATKPEEISETPSHEFLKWLGDSLKGLNSSANVEEIMSMLLSFPSDADSSTLEIISDTIYANSTTLDGRRFAAEFVTRRKADTAMRPRNISDSDKGLVKPISIADVVKTMPKHAQPEWGFKVVNKKKKNGRA